MKTKNTNHPLAKTIALFTCITSTAFLHIFFFPNSVTNSSYPTPYSLLLSFGAWFAFVPLLLAAHGQSVQRRFLMGWGAGTVSWLGILYWLWPTFKIAGVGIIPTFFAWFLLSAQIALYWGACLALTSWMSEKIYWPLIWASVWTLGEWGRTHFFFNGFPWCLLGDSQIQFRTLSQLASVTGVYGISFLIQWVNGATYQFIAKKELRVTTKTIKTHIIAFCVLSICIAVYGNSRLTQLYRESSNATDPVRVSLLQGNVDQYKKWDDTFESEIRSGYEQLVREAQSNQSDLIIWPETSVPGYLLQEPDLKKWLFNQTRISKASHLVGAPYWDGTYSYNSAFLITPTGEILGRQDKQHLVPFGEYVPFQKQLGRWIPTLNALGGFQAGDKPILLGKDSLGVSICYESIFPDLIREMVRHGAELLVNMTNDGWYLNTAAPYQHLVPNQFRAIESGRWMLRANNTGVTAIISPIGEITHSAPIFTHSCISGSVYRRTEKTLYAQYGNLWLFAAFVGLLIYWRHARVTSSKNR